MEYKKEISVDTPYLDSSFLDLPSDKYWAVKSHTGMGGTSAALNSSKPTLIITPNVSQIKSKLDFNNIKGFNIFYIYGESKSSWHSLEALGSKGFKTCHIYATYNSMKALQNEKKYSVLYKKLTKTHMLVVDEAHSIISKNYMQVYSSIMKAVKQFSKVILTTATPPEIIMDRDLESVPAYYFNKNCLPKEVNFYQTKESDAKNNYVYNLAIKNQNNKIHTLIFTNNVKTHQKLFDNVDNVAGSNLSPKIQIYNHNEDYKQINYDKYIHIISSAGFEGMDFKHDAHVVILSRYNTYNKSNATAFTYNDVVQAIGRVRTKVLQIDLFVSIDKGFLKKQERTIELVKDYRALKALSKNSASEMSVLLKRYLNELVKENSEINYKNDNYLGISRLLNKKDSSQITFKNGKISSETNKTKNYKGISLEDKFRNILSSDEHISIIKNIGRSLKYENKMKVSKGVDRRETYQQGLSKNDYLLYASALFTLGSEISIKSISKKRKDLQSKAVFNSVLKVIYFLKRNKSIEELNSLLNDLAFKDFTDTTNMRLNNFETEIKNNIIDSLKKIDAYNMSSFCDKHIEVPKFPLIEFTRSEFIKLLVNFVLAYSIKYYSSLIKPIIEDAYNEVYEEFINSGGETSNIHDGFCKSYISGHKDYLEELFLVYNNRSKDVSVNRGYRVYNSATKVMKELRILAPINLTEIDFKQLNPRIVANKLALEGYPKFNYSLSNEDLYSSYSNENNITRSIAKQEINSVFNYHDDIIGSKEWKKSITAMGIEEEGADFLINEFNHQGEFYKYATKKEEELINELSLKVNPEMDIPQFRVHDALFLIGSHNISIKEVSVNGVNPFPVKVVHHKSNGSI